MATSVGGTDGPAAGALAVALRWCEHRPEPSIRAIEHEFVDVPLAHLEMDLQLEPVGQHGAEHHRRFRREDSAARCCVATFGSIALFRLIETTSKTVAAALWADNAEGGPWAERAIPVRHVSTTTVRAM